MLKRLTLLAETIVHLKPRQIVGQIMNKVHRPVFVSMSAPESLCISRINSTIVKPPCLNGYRFSFLNITDDFAGWEMMEHGSLWAYNLNYMDWLEQEDFSMEDGIKWIDKFIDELPSNRVGLEPYPIALRIINWAKFFSKHPECLSKRRNDSLYAQTLLLERKLEYHLLGNHLLEDSYALTIASVFFHDERLFRKASRLMIQQLKEQILPDGAHYEQSPMYHCIMLDRLLDSINFSLSNPLFDGQEAFTSTLKEKATMMLGHLQSIAYSDGTIPLLNDSAYGIAPTVKQLFDYAHRLNILWKPITLKECGYRKLGDSHIEVIADIGNITATYQPGHSHADTFSYELRIDGQPIIVDTGISTYNKNERRQYERSTQAHNTVSVGGKDSSHVWGGFRVGRRAKATVLKDEANDIIAQHNGFGRQAIHQRHFACKDGAFYVEDTVIGKEVEAVSYLHISPNLHAEIVSEADGLIKIGNITVKVEHCHRIELKKDYTSTEYTHLQSNDVLALSFIKSLRYSIG